MNVIKLNVEDYLDLIVNENFALRKALFWSISEGYQMKLMRNNEVALAMMIYLADFKNEN